MSNKSSSRIWDYSETTKTARLVLLSLADRADTDGFCWPSITDIAKRTKAKYETVVRILPALEHRGEIYINKRPGKNHQYLVHTGKSAEEIYESSSDRFGLSDEQITLWILFRVLTPDEMSGVPPNEISVVNFRPLTIRWGSTGLLIDTPDIHYSTPLTSRTYEPLFNHQLINHQEPIKDGPHFLIWSDILSHLKTDVDKATFDKYLLHSHFVSFEDGVFTVGVKSTFTRDWLESRLTSKTIRLLTGVMNQTVQVKFITLEVA